jgi:hypothetical protein
MKLSETQTAWLIIKSGTGSERTPFDFVLVALNPDYIKLLKERANLAYSLKGESEILCLVYWGDPKGWYRLSEEFEEIIDIFSEDELSWSFLCLEDDDLKGFTALNEPVDDCRIEIYTDGSARFKGSGGITDKDYWTSEFSIHALTQKAAL